MRENIFRVLAFLLGGAIFYLAFLTDEYANDDELTKIKTALAGTVLLFFALGGHKFLANVPLFQAFTKKDD